jgi:ligand-binding sensor domain-containing protein
MRRWCSLPPMKALLLLLCAACSRPVHEPGAVAAPSGETPAPTAVRHLFPQIHANLQGKVPEFVRCMHQDRMGRYWFGTNQQGVLLYDGAALRHFPLREGPVGSAIRGMAEDPAGGMWLATSDGLVRHDGARYTTYPVGSDVDSNELWTVALDDTGGVWVGGNRGAFRFDGRRFHPFSVPRAEVPDARPMLSPHRIPGIRQDRSRALWFITDGFGATRWDGRDFRFFTTIEGLPDSHITGVYEARNGDLWFGSYNGGVSRFDGTAYTHYTRDGVIEGVEAGGFLEDDAGGLWINTENHGLYRFDGTGFRHYTTNDGLTTNTAMSLLVDTAGRLWVASWSGICVLDGERFVDAGERYPWTR